MASTNKEKQTRKNARTKADRSKELEDDPSVDLIIRQKDSLIKAKFVEI